MKKFIRTAVVLVVLTGITITGCSSFSEMKAKLCLQDALCNNEDKAFVHTVLEVLETGRVILGYDGLPCAELDLTKWQSDGFEAGDILTITIKKFNENEPICPVKIDQRKPGTEMRTSAPVNTVYTTTDKIEIEY